ncbi:hypothetical protein ACFV6F_01595 [Kitasatospora phosalacinea]|uniref:hypothetical protein n=1 Tax=Kitasatospora phosalacinea TaxID=2065 RepID=UPI003659C154
MTRRPVAVTALRIAALPVAAAGLAFHLWLGTKVGLALAAAGLAVHLVATVLGWRRLLRRDRIAP